MKGKLPKFYLILMLWPILSFGQVTVSIENVDYVSGGSVNNGGPIEIPSGDDVAVNITVKLTKPSAQVVGNGNLRIFVENSVGNDVQVGNNQLVCSNCWDLSTNTFYQVSLNRTIESSQIDNQNSVLYAEYVSSSNVSYISSNWTVDILQQPITNNSISGNQTINQGQSASQIVGSTPNGGNGNYSYQWQRNTTGSWSNVSGATSKNHSPGMISQTTMYRRIVSSGNVANSTSNSITITINITPAINNNTIAFDGTSKMSGSTPSGGNGTYTYQWLTSNTIVHDEILSGENGKDLVVPQIAINYPSFNTHYKRIVSSGGQTSDSGYIPVHTVSAIGNNTITFDGNNKMIGSAPSGGNGSYTYQWLTSNTIVHDEILSGENGKDLVVPQIAINYPSFNTHYKRIVSSGGQTSDSGYIPVHSSSLSFKNLSFSSTKPNDINILNSTKNSEQNTVIYPNPSSGHIDFLITLDKPNIKVKIKLVQVFTGIEFNIFDNQIKSTEKIISWDKPSNLPNGIYLYVIQKDAVIESGKIIFR